MKISYTSFTYILIFFLVMLTMNACSEEFLVVDIKGDLIAESTEDYNALLSSRNQYQSFSPLIYALAPHVCMLEPFNAPGNGDLEKLPAFMWAKDIYLPDEDMEIVSYLVNNLYTYNKIVEEVLNSAGGNEREKLNIQAEAKANRAWTYFQLINLFGEPYDPATASNDLGFPIITQADINQSEFSRASVQEVYDFILDDLNSAIPNLESISSRIRMSKEAATALLGQVHIFMGNYSEGLVQLDAAMDDLANSPVETGLYNFNETSLPGGVHGPGFFGPGAPDLGVNIEEPFIRVYTNIDAFFSGEVLLDPEVISVYDTSDLRFKVFYVNTPNPFAPPIPLPNFYRKVGNLLTSFGINMPDLHLLRAECKVRLNDLSGAIEDLEFLRKHRMPEMESAVPTGLSQNDLLFYVIDERTREFAVLGKEWFTIRRLSVDPLFSNRTYTHTIFQADGSVKETYTLSKERMVLRFNQRLMNQNPNFTNNP